MVDQKLIRTLKRIKIPHMMSNSWVNINISKKIFSSRFNLGMATAAPLIFFVILSLCTLYTLAVDNVFTSIDCGSSSQYKDEDLITWNGDDGYIRTGESRKVPSSNSTSHVMDTLRVFTDRRKNCYNIGSIRAGRTLVRAGFYYGNYDGKSSPPSFDLQFDGNHWANVTTSSTDFLYHEVIYDMKKKNISVCVAQTKTGQFPFISTLEVRGLPSHMYTTELTNVSYPLFLLKRVAYAANSTIRSPNDPYDRIWAPEHAGPGRTELYSNNVISNPGLGEVPPPAALKSAISPINPNSSMLLGTGFLPFVAPVYLNFYFSEVALLQPGQNRTFVISDGGSSTSPISPPVGNFTRLLVYNYTMSPNTSLYLVPTNYSTLPPLINAMEVFLIGDMTTNGTNDADVNGLTSLQNSFDILQTWRGDPCLPYSYTWEWINCTTDSVPRVTALFLGSFGLSGLLPNFSSMDRLETIDLHNNSLTGPIPAFLGTLPNLRELNLANNKFNGTIPPSISQKRGLNLILTGNGDLCSSDNECRVSGSNNWRQRNNRSPIICGLTLLSLFFLHIPSF